MTHTEIRDFIESFRADLKPLREQIQSEIEARGIERVTNDMHSFLAPKLSSELFSEIRGLAKEYERHNYNAMRIYSDATAELRNVRSAIQRGLFYMDMIRAEDSLDFDELQKIAKDNVDNAYRLISEVGECYSDLCLLAWNIYFTELDTESLLNEIKTIARAFHTIEENIDAEGFTAVGETNTNITADINTPYISGTPSYIMPGNHFSLPLSKQREVLNSMLEPMFEEYLTAITARQDARKTAEANDAISKMLDRLSDSKNILTVKPDTFYATIDKVGNQLSLLTPNEEWSIRVENQKDKKKGLALRTKVLLTFNDERDENNIDRLDEELWNVIFTLWETAKQIGAVQNGTVVTTLQTIYQLLTKNHNSRIDEDREIDLIDRLLKLNGANLNINATEEGAYYQDLKEFERRGSILNIVIDGAIVNGTYVKNAVHIIRLDLSPRYLYAKIKNSITSTPMAQLSTHAKSKTDENILIEAYLRMRIETAEGQGTLIRTDAILEHAGIDYSAYKNPKDKKKRTIKKITDALEGFKENGYIGGWHWNAKSRDKYYSITFKPVKSTNKP